MNPHATPFHVTLPATTMSLNAPLPFGQSKTAALEADAPSIAAYCRKMGYAAAPSRLIRRPAPRAPRDLVSLVRGDADTPSPEPPPTTPDLPPTPTPPTV